MEISQKDRDALRAAQHKLNPSFHIGNIVEHQIQDPKRYKIISRKEQGLINTTPEMPKIEYKSSYLDSDLEQQSNDDQSSVIDLTDRCILPTISENTQEDLPITIEDVHANMWLNMDKIEWDKMEWMTNKAIKAFQEKMKTTTHFDQEGRAIAPNAAKEETSQQAHDVGSLIKLLDSVYQPQITYSLNVISKIAAYASMGYYDGAFDENIHQILLKESLLRVRRHIDSPNETICQSALKCLRSLICNAQIDEIFLDRTYPINSEKISGFWLQTVEMATQEINDEMSDNKCAEIDTILTLVARTDILTRFAYLLETKTGNFSNTYKDCILDILLRIARHSKEICFILSSEGLLKLVIDNFLPVAVVFENKLVQSLALRALKFVRIIAQASRELRHVHYGSKIKIPTEILKPIQAFYYIDCYSLPVHNNKDNHLFMLHIETLRLMKALSLIEEFKKDIFDIIMMDLSHLCKNFKTLSGLTSTDIIKSRISLDWQYAGHLFDLTGCVMTYERYNSDISAIGTIWGTHVGPIAMQWMHDIIQDNVIPHLDVSIAIAKVVNHVKKYRLDEDKSFDCFASMNSLFLNSNDRAKDDITNAGLTFFNHLLQVASNKSQLVDILEIDGRQRDPKMLPSFGCLNFNSSEYYDYKFCNVVESNSPFVLLEMFTNLLQKSGCNLEEFVNNIYLMRYLRLSTKYYVFPHNYESVVQQSILAQCEVQIMANSMLLSAKYYLELPSNDYIPGDRCNPEPVEISSTRSESYSQLFFYAVSIIGLISPRQDHLVTLKDGILDRVLLSNELHLRLSRDFFSKKSNNERLKYYKLDHSSGDFDYNPMKPEVLLLLKTIYINCEQSGRFWLFQPIIDYYSYQINESDESKKNKDGKWFASVIDQQIDGTGLLEGFSDALIISEILTLNAGIMRHAPCYSRICVRPNIEEYLCLVGSIFLDDELFLDQEVSLAIRSNLLALIYECLEEGEIFNDATRKITTLGLVLADFFNKIVDQFEAASYGDTAFSNFLLLFLNPHSDKVFKKKLFSEKLETCLAQIKIPVEAVWAREEIFFGTKENDPEIKDLIRRAGPFLKNGTFLDAYRKHHGDC